MKGATTDKGRLIVQQFGNEQINELTLSNAIEQL